MRARLGAIVAAFVIVACDCGDESGPSDPCAALVCEGGACVLVDGGPTCACPEGTRLEGTACVAEPCASVDCSYQGACVERDDSFVCDCDDGFVAVGAKCVWRRHFGCEDLDCGPGAGCTTTDYGFACACPEGTRSTGTTCAPPSANPCADVACSGHGACVAVGGAPSCTCEAGYTVSSDGLACLPNAPTESCVDVGADCSGAVTFTTCCTGARCEYVASTGERYAHGVDAEQHCMTGVAAPTTYGRCVGVPDDCSTLNGDPDACVAAGCIPDPQCNGLGCEIDDERETCEAGGCAFTELCLHPGGATNAEYGRTCGFLREEAACDERPGCVWREHVPVPSAAADPACAPMTTTCVAGRDYHLCCDNACEAVFEDGTVLRGTQSITGYCQGVLDASDVAAEDGTCLSRCQELTTEAECIARECSWNASVSECEGRTPQCFFQFGREACEAYGPCLWFDADEPIHVPPGGHVTGRYPAILPPGHFVVESSPITTQQCADTETACYYPMGRLVSIGGGPLDKVLPNNDYALLAGTPYRAVADGRVTSVSQIGVGDYGIFIVSASNPNVSYNYDHVALPMVSVGDDVVAGDVLGLPQGETGISAFELSITEQIGSYGPVDVCVQRFATSRVIAEHRAFMMLANLAQLDGEGAFFTYALCLSDTVYSF